MVSVKNAYTLKSCNWVDPRFEPPLPVITQSLLNSFYKVERNTGLFAFKHKTILSKVTDVFVSIQQITKDLMQSQRVATYERYCK